MTGVHSVISFLLFALFGLMYSKNALFRSYSTFVYLLRVYYISPKKYAFVHNYSAHGHELSGCVCADADAYI